MAGILRPHGMRAYLGRHALSTHVLVPFNSRTMVSREQALAQAPAVVREDVRWPWTQHTSADPCQPSYP